MISMRQLKQEFSVALWEISDGQREVSKSEKIDQNMGKLVPNVELSFCYGKSG